MNCGKKTETKNDSISYRNNRYIKLQINSNMRIFIIYLLVFLGANEFVYSQQLTSGHPIPGGTPTGNFALPSLTGSTMGVVQIPGKTKPSLFLYGDKLNPGISMYQFNYFSSTGQPVFSQPIPINSPFEDDGSNRGVVLQDKEGEIYGFWRFSNTIRHARYNAATNRFEDLKTIAVKGLPRGYSSFSVIPLENGKFLFVFSVRQPGTFSNPTGNRDSLYFTPEGFWPYELPYEGIYGKMVDDFKEITSIEPVAFTGYDVGLFTINGFTRLRHQSINYLICGTRLGILRAYGIDIEKGRLTEGLHLVDPDHILHRHPTVNTFPTYFSADGKEGIITSGEGGIFFYLHTKKQDKSGNIVFEHPLPLQQENALLYGGSLVVPNLVDWDGDGLIDIVSGTSTGHILFFKNQGTNKQPSYIPPVPLSAGGREIHIQPGYREDIQGPGEARWGYSCPTVFDWNGDGLPDILTGDSRGKFMVYINKGTKNKPLLDVERPLYLDGMNMYGGWRVKPGIAEMNGETSYIILDRDNELHLYWRIDNYNLRDGGKLLLEDGSPIRANRRPGGQVGRIKIHIVDWDQDGTKDLLIGTGRAQSIPNPKNGLPFNWGEKNQGATILFMKNVGSNAKPVYTFPKMLKFKDEFLLLGAHSCSPTTAAIGSDNELNLLVGVEKGVYMFYDYHDLSW